MEAQRFRWEVSRAMELRRTAWIDHNRSRRIYEESSATGLKEKL